MRAVGTLFGISLGSLWGHVWDFSGEIFLSGFYIVLRKVFRG